MSDPATFHAINEIAGSIEIPESAYEKAEARYKDLGEWFGRREAQSNKYAPHIYPQGSFRLGTVIRPLNDTDEYDLDMGCRLEKDVTKQNCSQIILKRLVGADVEAYRVARNIQEKMEEKHRCWRLKFADTLKFHLDVVPSIPETAERRRQIQQAIIRAGDPSDLAIRVANLTGAITDNQDPNYQVISDAWRLSNSEGFALWFESRMLTAEGLSEDLAIRARAAKVDKLPAFRWKTPLQRCVQILKRHRDMMFAKAPDGKPASIILTTLAARAYQGERDITDALAAILSTMGTLVRPNAPRVPNPVNPAEDFADRWAANPALEVNFWNWLRRANEDFNAIRTERKPDLIIRAARDKFGASLNETELKAKLGQSPAGGLLKAAAVPSGLSFPDKPLAPQKPAGFA
jgi:hypothetical protein